jgi:hypothetical protein
VNTGIQEFFRDWKNLDPGFRRGDGFKGFGAFFLSPFEGLISSSLRLCRKYGDFPP